MNLANIRIEHSSIRTPPDSWKSAVGVSRLGGENMSTRDLPFKFWQAHLAQLTLARSGSC